MTLDGMWCRVQITSPATNSESRVRYVTGLRLNEASTAMNPLQPWILYWKRATPQSIRNMFPTFCAVQVGLSKQLNFQAQQMLPMHICSEHLWESIQLF